MLTDKSLSELAKLAKDTLQESHSTNFMKSILDAMEERAGDAELAQKIKTHRIVYLGACNPPQSIPVSDKEQINAMLYEVQKWQRQLVVLCTEIIDASS